MQKKTRFLLHFSHLFRNFAHVMAKDKVMYVCENCGQESAKWIGKCPSCGQWNTFKEIKVSDNRKTVAATSAAASAGHQLRQNKILRLKDISAHDDPRIDMQDAELNRVLGGGLVPGSIVLLGGEPGIGKSTLSLQTMLNLTATRPQLKVVFDQTGTPTYALDLASAICDILENRKFEGNTGVYHYSNEGVCSWFDFTKMIQQIAVELETPETAENFGTHGACEVLPCHSDEFPSPVKRPAYSVLDKTKVKRVFGISVPYWTDSLKKCINNLKQK